MIRRQAFRLGAGVVYCKDKGDRETVVYHVGACLGKASDCLRLGAIGGACVCVCLDSPHSPCRESVRADSFTHPLMVFRPGADSAELIAATLPAELPDAGFDQLFGGDDRNGPDGLHRHHAAGSCSLIGSPGSGGRPPVVVAMPHEELVERVRQAVTELELSQASSNVRTPARRRRHVSFANERRCIRLTGYGRTEIVEQHPGEPCNLQQPGQFGGDAPFPERRQVVLRVAAVAESDRRR